jgi:molybdenum cofactor cytidylyltransferase
MLSSVKCGFYSLPEGCLAALIMPGDQPMTGPGEINSVISSFLESDRGLVMAAHNGKRGHPLIVDMKYLDEVLSLPGEDGLRVLADSILTTCSRQIPRSLGSPGHRYTGRLHE